jgi:Cdc6-like AAA superfamily ATPase
MNVQTSESNPILQSIEKIALTFKDSEINENKRKKILHELKEETKIVGNFLHCNEDEAWIFAVLFAMSISGKDTDLDSLTHYLGCNPFLVVGFTPILESLVNKRLLIKNSSYDIKIIATRFHVSSFIFNAITANKSIPKNDKFEDVYEVIERINEMICERDRNNQSTEDLFSEVNDLLQREARYSLIKKILNLRFNEDDTLLLMYLCYSYANDANEADIERYIYYVYDSMGSKIRAKKNLFSGQSRLLEEDWVCFIEESFYGGKELALTDKAIDLLFAEDLGTIEKNRAFQPKNCILFQPDKIKSTALFFNETENKQLELLQRLLEENNFQKARQKFEKLGFASNITILLYGEPGTGKTQIAYNMAKQTGRAILMVDIASIRDKYVGESEKRIKQIFRTYKQARDYFDKYPILFFNESDALISKRLDLSSSVDQMNNTMQNILLQELEDFEGILIATSNMSQNLDEAFERRFLYKIQFEKPEAVIRELIWQAKMPDLSTEECKTLAENYLFTGGQIHNVSRKYWLNHILQDDKPNLDDLKELCEAEYFGKHKIQKLGFKSN